jgi:hypothetical protein
MDRSFLNHSLFSSCRTHVSLAVKTLLCSLGIEIIIRCLGLSCSSLLFWVVLLLLLLCSLVYISLSCLVSLIILYFSFLISDRSFLTHFVPPIILSRRFLSPRCGCHNCSDTAQPNHRFENLKSQTVPNS